jgi:hypothetical protein
MTNTELVEKKTNVATTSSLPEAPDDFKNANESICENCKQALSGPFCGQCGQQAESTLKYFWLVILHLLDDILSFDSRAARTLFPLVTRPGFLTNEYFSGRRVHYVPPLRLYLFISIVFFITLKFFVASENNNILNINDNQSVITELKSHITLLKEKQTIAMLDKQVNAAELSRIENDLSKYSLYLTDIKKVGPEDKNELLIQLTKELVELELDQFNDHDSFSEKDKLRFELLTSKIVKIKSGEQKSKPVVISNNKEGTLTFDFLTEDTNKKLTAFANELSNKAEKAFNSDATPLIQEVIGKLPQLMFILLPLFAVLLKIIFMFSKRLYMEHLTVALHSHSFIFFTLLLIEFLDVFSDYSETVLPSLTGTVELAIKALLIWIPIYLFIMQKRVYKQGYFFTFIKYNFIGMAYILLIALTGVIAFIWGLTDI